jgi:hypothetical protein
MTGATGDPGAPTINIKNVDGGPPGPHGGSDPHSGCEQCAINLHGYDRQGVILLTGPITLRLVLLWLRDLGRLTGHG